MKKHPKIYIDLDGVLVNFLPHLQETTGLHIDEWVKLGKQERWQPVIDKGDFWHTAPWHPEGKKLFEFVEKYEPHILSAYVTHANDPSCIPGKSHWVQTNTTITEDKINLVLRKEKQDYTHDEDGPTILIDDYERNISEFKKKGGIGIHFQTAEQTINELKELGF